MNSLVLLCFFVIVLVVINIFFYFLFKRMKMKKIIQQTNKNIVEEILKSRLISEKIISDTEKKISLLKKEADNDLTQRRKIIINLEEKIIHKEELLDNRMKYLNEKEELLYTKEQKINNNQRYLEKLQNQAQDIINKQLIKLEEISFLTLKQAQDIIMKKAKENVFIEMNNYMKQKEEEFKFQLKKKAKNLLVSSMQQISRNENIFSHNISMVFLEKDDLKGRIIGKEGRNIKTFEIITGVDLIIDDVPNTVLLSSFDSVRREIAKRTLEELILDGRITPSSIEKTFQKMSIEVDNFIQEIGEEAVFDTKVGFMDEELIKLLGKLHFRTSYSQNILNHSLEVSYLSGKLAAEIGENEIMARRAGLLHDIGKSLDYHAEGSHVKIGIELAIKYKEPKEVIDAIASHHEDKEPSTIIAILVSIADTISSSRPGARKENVESYFQRITHLEKIADEIEGVSKSYAIRSGRELRVIVKSEYVDDLSVFSMARTIKEKIQKTISYNGIIKITVIKEVRAVEIAEINN
ncbi:ribonuclease Y [Candidatus Phytoplasma palmae]|uniref:ribonuclease Y n=1 Tax=Candidatus Phytoplasma palmae TaxID=85624 RepID=UPI00399055D1